MLKRSIIIFILLIALAAQLPAGSVTNASASTIDGLQSTTGSTQAQPGTRAKIYYRPLTWEGAVETPMRTRDGVVVYAGPSLRSRRIGAIPFNATPVEIIEEGTYVEAEQVVWARIKYGKLVGWTDPRLLFACDVYLDNTLVFTTYLEGRGCAQVFEITYSPTYQHFLVITHVFEAENDIYLLQANGRGLRKITEGGDFLALADYTWAADGRSFTYRRSTDYPVAGPIPPLPPGWGVRYDLRTGEKTTRGFRVVNVRRGDVLNIRSRPSVQSRIVGTIPPNGTNVTYIGGLGVRAEGVDWWRVRYGNVTGYVNSAFLRCGVPADPARWQNGLC